MFLLKPYMCSMARSMRNLCRYCVKLLPVIIGNREDRNVLLIPEYFDNTERLMFESQ